MDKNNLLEKVLDNNLLNIEYQDSEIIVLTFFGDIDDCLYYGGFVIDKNYDILKASCNIIEKGTGKRYPVQFITKSDGCNLCDFFDTVLYGKERVIALLLPKTFILERRSNTCGGINSMLYLIKKKELYDACCWKNYIIIPNKNHELYEYAPLHQAHITTEDYIANILDNINIEKSLNNQLRCAKTIKGGLDNVADGLGEVASSIKTASIFIGKSISDWS